MTTKWQKLSDVDPNILKQKLRIRTEDRSLTPREQKDRARKLTQQSTTQD